jgi:TRAP-type C4-dicarboxylate transport system permease small subunit
MVSFKENSISLARIFNGIAALAVIAMMLLTCADVVLRLFRRPIPGTYEMVSFLGVVTVSFALAYTSVMRGHVAVNLVVRILPKKVQAIIDSIISILGILLFGLISWQSIVYGMSHQKAGEVSMTLKLPIYPVIYGVALGAAAVCLVLLTDLINAVVKLKEK